MRLTAVKAVSALEKKADKIINNKKIKDLTIKTSIFTNYP